MMEDAERAVIFGRDAAAYDAARPEYPVQVVDHVLSRTEVSFAVEIGAGTGLATAGFADRVERTICLEPSAEMAAVLEAKKLPGVSVETVTFENWALPRLPVDLIYAAQAWHWVDHATAYDKARKILRPGGIIALIWNVPLVRYQRFADVYREHGPEILAENNERIGRRDSPTWLSDLERAGFEDVHLVTHPWSVDLTPSEVRMLYSTYSDHMMIPEPRRTELLDQLESAVVASGGSVEVEYESRAFVGRR